MKNFIFFCSTAKHGQMPFDPRLTLIHVFLKLQYPIDVVFTNNVVIIVKKRDLIWSNVNLKLLNFGKSIVKKG